MFNNSLSTVLNQLLNIKNIYGSFVLIRNIVGSASFESVYDNFPRRPGMSDEGHPLSRLEPSSGLSLNFNSPFPITSLVFLPQHLLVFAGFQSSFFFFFFFIVFFVVDNGQLFFSPELNCPTFLLSSYTHTHARARTPAQPYTHTYTPPPPHTIITTTVLHTP